MPLQRGRVLLPDFTRVYGLETISFATSMSLATSDPLRGTRESCRALLAAASGERPVIFGDGGRSRDFTYI